MTSKIVVNNIESDSGVSTVTFNSNVERGSSNLHSTGLNVNDTFVHSTGIALGAGSTVGAVTGVTTYYGDGSQLTGISAGVSLANGADNRVVTATGAAALAAESSFTFDGTDVQIPDKILLNTAGTYVKSNQLQFKPSGTAYIDHATTSQDIQIRMSTSSSLDTTGPKFKSDGSIELASNKGIYFGSANAADYLDDYEEGSWTGAIVTGTATISDEWYVKIGRLVIGAGRASAISDTSSGNAITISGLPFSASGGEEGYGACAWSKMDASNTSTMSRVNGSTLQFMRSSQSTGSWNYVLHSNMVQSSGGFHFGFNYFVA